MRTHPILFLQACGHFGVRLGGHRLYNRSRFVSPWTQGYFPASSRSSFVHRSIHLHNIPRLRSVFSQGITMVATQDSNPDQTAENEAMLAKGKLIMQRLEEVYPKAPEGFLNHTDAFTLLISVVLSAQSLDVKVNEITPNLFKVGGTPEMMRELGETKIRDIIKQIGLAPQKAKNIAKLSEMICEQFDGKVPDTFEGLESLPGVGHKTASVVMMQAFNKPAFPVDTHIHRLACRWGCGDAKSVDKTEAALKMWFPDPATWGHLHTRIILFGREHCPARKHDMDQCPICSFAATDEARAINRQNPNKFIAPKSHKTPYSIRDVPKVDPREKDPSYSPVQNSPGPKKTGANTKKGATGKRVDNGGSEKRRLSRRKKVNTKDELEEGDDGTEAPTKRPRRGRRTKSATANTSEVLEDGMKDVEDFETADEGKTVTQAGKQSGARRKEENETAIEEVVQANGEAPRRSSRVRRKKKLDVGS